MIEIRGLTKMFGENTVLKDFNLSIADRSTFGLVGINGAGKSTLLRLMAGVYKADAGEILIDGQNIFDNPEKKREVFFLPDDLHYTPTMNGENMADFYRTFYNFDNKIFYDYINTYRLDLHTSLRSYSKGMKRQLFVCLAFASSPKYLFLDEAFDGLDPAARMIFKRGLVDTMSRSGGTAIISSHSLRELEDICDSYGIIDGKKITSHGSLSDSLETTFKFQIAFSIPMSRYDFAFNCVSFESSGKIVKIVARGNKEQILAKIWALNPLIVEEMPLDFEEFFISEVGNNALLR